MTVEWELGPHHSKKLQRKQLHFSQVKENRPQLLKGTVKGKQLHTRGAKTSGYVIFAIMKTLKLKQRNHYIGLLNKNKCLFHTA